MAHTRDGTARRRRRITKKQPRKHQPEEQNAHPKATRSHERRQGPRARLSLNDDDSLRSGFVVTRAAGIIDAAGREEFPRSQDFPSRSRRATKSTPTIAPPSPSSIATS